MEKMQKNNLESLSSDDLGFLLWQLGELEEFYPCYKSMLRRNE
jgi:hypothetical protein